MENTQNNSTKDLKIIVIGNSGTGKTSIVNQWTKGSFEESYKPTVVSEFSYKIIEINGVSYKVQIWDLAGMDKNAYITKIFSKDSHGVLVVSDINDVKTLEDTTKWKKSVDDTTRFIDGDLLPAVLVRNKVDLLEGEKDDEELVKNIMEENKFCNCFKTSAKLGQGIEECMDFLIKNIIERLGNCPNSDPFAKDTKNLVLENTRHKTKIENASGGCC